jgi:hypothetical protein
MTKHEYGKGESDRYYEFMAIDKKLTWRLVGPAQLLAVQCLSRRAAPDPWVSPVYLQYID